MTTRKFDFAAPLSLLTVQAYHLNVGKPLTVQGTFGESKEVIQLIFRLNGMSLENGVQAGTVAAKWNWTGMVLNGEYQNKPFAGCFDFAEGKGFLKINPA